MNEQSCTKIDIEKYNKIDNTIEILKSRMISKQNDVGKILIKMQGGKKKERNERRNGRQRLNWVKQECREDKMIYNKSDRKVDSEVDRRTIARLTIDGYKD